MQVWGTLVEMDSAMSKGLDHLCGRFSTGIVRLRGKFLTYIKPHLDDVFLVDPTIWNTCKRGHLPVANALLRFDEISGDIMSLTYKASHYIKEECRVNIVYDPSAPTSDSLETLLKQWWPDPQTRRAFLIATIYALSRTACKEVVFVVVGATGTAKSSYNNLLKTWFGTRHVWPVSSNFACTTKGQVQHQDGMNSHNTNELDAAKRAMVIVNECSGTMVWKTDFLKRFTGDDSSGRRANASECEEQPRLATPFVVVNSIPALPKKVADTAAIFRRIRILKRTAVFYADEKEKKKLMDRMSAQDVASSVWTKADSAVVRSVIDDPVAKVQFLNLLIRSWKSFVVEDSKELRMTKDALEIYDSYVGDVVEGDSVSRFMAECLIKDRHSAVKSQDLFKAYSMWHAEILKTQDTSLEEIPSFCSFSKRVRNHTADWSIICARQSKVSVSLLSGAQERVKRRTSVYRGVTFKRTFF